MTPDRIHDLLPWFVNGTLEREELESFERHLMECADCRKEIEFLRKLEREFEIHGDDLLAEHPPAERLVALCVPGSPGDEVTEEEATRLRRHLALCATCAEEARWLTGEATAQATGSAPRPRRDRRLVWVAAAAVLLIAVALTPWLAIDRPELPPGSFLPRLIEETRRGAVPVEVPVAPGADHVFLVVPVDLDPGALPAKLEILDADRRTVHREDVRTENLYARRYLFVAVLRSDFPDGDYVAQLRGTGPDTGTEYVFRIVTAPARAPALEPS